MAQWDIIEENRKKSFGQNLSEVIGSGIDVAQKLWDKKERDLAAKKLGFDPDVFKLPEYAQAEYFKNQFIKGKEPTELQKAQAELARAKAKQAASEENLFNEIYNDSNENKNENVSNEFESQEINDLLNEDTKNKTNPNQKKSNIKLDNFSEKKLSKLASFAGQPGKKGILGTMAKDELERKRKTEEKDEKRFLADRDYNSKISLPIVQAAQERLKSSDVNKAARNQIKVDINSGNTSGFFPYVVDKLGLESFRNPESARFSNEVKTLFVNTLNDIPGARPNIFLENIIATSQPQIGRSKEANSSTMDLVDFVEDVKDEIAKKELEVAKEDREKYGYVKEDVAERAKERMGDFVNKKAEETAINIREKHENTLDDAALLDEIIGKKITPGTYVTPRTMGILNTKNGKDLNKAIKEAKSLGMVIPQYIGK